MSHLLKNIQGLCKIVLGKTEVILSYASHYLIALIVGVSKSKIFWTNWWIEDQENVDIATHLRGKSAGRIHLVEENTALKIFS